jgi:hypothetical protein
MSLFVRPVVSFGVDENGDVGCRMQQPEWIGHIKEFPWLVIERGAIALAHVNLRSDPPHLCEILVSPERERGVDDMPLVTTTVWPSAVVSQKPVPVAEFELPISSAKETRTIETVQARASGMLWCPTSILRSVVGS